MSFFAELKRRNVFRVGAAYLLIAWVALQGADFVLDLVDAPNWVIQALTLAVAIGLPFALVLAWAYELTPEGVKRESEVDRSQSITPKTGRQPDRSPPPRCRPHPSYNPAETRPTSTILFRVG